MSSELPETSTDAERAAFMDSLGALGMRNELRTALIFVLAGDENELEESRGGVEETDVPGLVSAYWQMPDWSARTGVGYLLQDHGGQPEVLPVWVDVLAAPDLGPGTVRHIVQAAAVAWLKGDIDLMERYLDDHELMRRHGAAWVGPTTGQGSSPDRSAGGSDLV
jgi:hypothetical protein